MAAMNRTRRRRWRPRICTVFHVRRVSTMLIDVGRTSCMARLMTTWPTRSARRWSPRPVLPVHSRPARLIRSGAASVGPTASLAKSLWTIGLTSSDMGTLSSVILNSACAVRRHVVKDIYDKLFTRVYAVVIITFVLRYRATLIT